MALSYIHIIILATTSRNATSNFNHTAHITLPITNTVLAAELDFVLPLSYFTLLISTTMFAISYEHTHTVDNVERAASCPESL